MLIRHLLILDKGLVFEEYRFKAGKKYRYNGSY